ncbi:hypothetical protein EUTSA_v100286090mg, partial [Eutrema salsugineum]
MGGVRLSLFKSLNRSIKNSSCKQTRLAEYASLGPAKSSPFQKKERYASFRAIGCGYPLDRSSLESKPSLSIVSSFSSSLRLHNAKPFLGVHSSFLGGHSSYPRAFSTGTGDGNGIDWVDKAKDVLHTSVDAVTETARKAKESSAELSPHVQQLLDSNPYLKDVIVPVSLTMT